MTDESKPSVVRPLPSWVPAGWYPDPLDQGQARYWDGKRWTLEYRDSPPPDPVPASPSDVPASSPPSAEPGGATTLARPVGFRDRWRELPKGARIVIWVAGVILLISVIGAIAGGGKNKNTASSEPATAAQASTQKPAPPPPPVPLKLATGDYAVTSSHTTLHGTVPASASVTVEGAQAHIHGTHWSKTVALEIGSNVVNVEATMAGHEPASQTITVVRHHTQAELEAKAQARREREQREREANERRERKERAEKEIEDASLSRQNALHEAESYLQSSSFSEAGLIEQLSSEAGSKFPLADAEWAVHHLRVDWNEQAAKEAKSYLSSSSFSCQGLIEQLSSEAGSKFTQAQAEYGAKQAGIC
jgi:Host cell surface-exposed lipoprotein/Protein of unknown function (DUF2510)/Glucodextranase, domain B